MGQRSFYRSSDSHRHGGPSSKPLPAYRTEWRRDYARLVHSASFRRLQGKTQLFYGTDSVYRNRLTHSIEVAQIAKILAIKINADCGTNIEPDIAEIAGLAHDLGHPPFGHNGERALDQCMRASGGFEGNAQTLRIVARLEKRHRTAATEDNGLLSDGTDGRLGMDLTYRVLAAMLKYDNLIPIERDTDSDLVKGYYYTEQDLVESIRQAVVGRSKTTTFRTIECSIMDIADDIAYSTYDLEDAWKSGFLSPAELLSLPTKKLQRVGDLVRRVPRLSSVTDEQVLDSLLSIVSGVLAPESSAPHPDDADSDPHATMLIGAVLVRDRADQLARSSYSRLAFTSDLVERFIGGVTFRRNGNSPPLSSVAFDEDTLLCVESIKQYTYVSVIDSPRLRIPEFRGEEVVRTIFESISSEKTKGFRLLPEDVRDTYTSLPKKDLDRKLRVICDFVAGMTDSYAVDMYNRLTRDYPTTIFGPGL